MRVVISGKAISGMASRHWPLYRTECTCSWFAARLLPSLHLFAAHLNHFTIATAGPDTLNLDFLFLPSQRELHPSPFWLREFSSRSSEIFFYSWSKISVCDSIMESVFSLIKVLDTATSFRRHIAQWMRCLFAGEWHQCHFKLHVPKQQ